MANRPLTIECYGSVMAQTACPRCKKDLARMRMLRCSDVRCPLQSGESATRGAVLWRVAGGMMFAVLLVGIGFSFLAPGSVGREPDANGFASARPQSGDSWLERTFGKAQPVSAPAPQAADPMQSERPDPRAGQRVQSFDCSATTTISRQLVCTRWDLATADYNLTIAYRAALEASPRPAELRKAYREWLRELDRLGDDADAVRAHYEKLSALLTRA